jgi:hypothetical protein
MAGEPTSTASPPLRPPIMEVGYNYTWPFNRYGTSIGPRNVVNREGAPAPSGANDATPVFRDPAQGGPLGTLDRNLKILKNELNIKKVRMFLMGNAFNYGAQPINTPGGRSVFIVPQPPNPLFFDHFRQMLEVFRQNDMQIMPSLLDFGAFYPFGGGQGGGRTSILTNERLRFIEFMLAPMLRVANEPAVRPAVFAFEIVNEPKWNTITIPGGRPHTPSSDRDVEPSVMASFLTDCLRVIEGNGFLSTVGHRHLSDLAGPMPRGQLPQFHYYGKTGLLRGVLDTRDDNPIPTHADLKARFGVNQVICGEFSCAGSGDIVVQLLNPGEQGAAWPEANGADQTDRAAAFERLAVLARKGYDLAFVWPDRPDDRVVSATDVLKLTNDAKESIKQFTRGRFPNGVPRAP